MKPTDPIDNPARPSLQYGAENSGLSPLGARERPAGRLGGYSSRQQIAILATILVAIALLTTIVLIMH